MEEFKIEKDGWIELCSLLKVLGLVASGGMAKAVIADGQVLVDDKRELRKRCKLRSGQVVQYAGRSIRLTE